MDKCWKCGKLILPWQSKTKNWGTKHKWVHEDCFGKIVDDAETKIRNYDNHILELKYQQALQKQRRSI